MERALLLGLALDESRRLTVAQKRQRAIDEIKRLFRLLVAALGFFVQGIHPLFEAFEIGQHQLGLDRLDIGDRIDAALDMRDVGILKAAHDMGDGIDLADIGEELVAEPLAFRSAAH